MTIVCPRTSRATRCVLAASALMLLFPNPASAIDAAGLQEPIHRVARDNSSDQPSAQVASRIVPPPSNGPFNLVQQEGEHPLMPALRVAKESLVNVDQNIQDYQAIVYKQERIDGVLGEEEVAYVKVRHQPFGVYMFFLKPNKGRECVYSDGPDGEEGKLHARDCGFRKRLGVFELDPNGRLAMAGQRYPITKLGVRALTEDLVMVASNDVKYGECEVRTLQTTIGAKNAARPVTLIEVTHPTPRKNFRFHKAQVFIDNELRVPIRYAAYLWPANPGEAPPLEEAYTYVNLKINNGFTDLDFSRDNPAYYK
ncbi:DUF1571 domain-containing protein [Pirellulales bacterium]|nr:DUF1571 domain-containing protein [Pirellulales bacterium]